MGKHRETCSRSPFSCRSRPSATGRLYARLTDRESHGVIREIVSKRTTCRIKRLFSEKEKQADFGSKDCARNLAKRAHRQNYAVLNRHQHRAYGLRDEQYLRLKILTSMLPQI